MYILSESKNSNNLPFSERAKNKVHLIILLIRIRIIIPALVLHRCMVWRNT